MTNGKYTYGENFIMYITVESLCCTSETHGTVSQLNFNNKWSTHMYKRKVEIKQILRKLDAN